VGERGLINRWNCTSPYPPYVRGEEQRRRWRLVTAAALLVYGYTVGDSLDHGDRLLIWYTQRALFSSDAETGEGDLSEDQRAWLADLGLV